MRFLTKIAEWLARLRSPYKLGQSYPIPGGPSLNGLFVRTSRDAVVEITLRDGSVMTFSLGYAESFLPLIATSFRVVRGVAWVYPLKAAPKSAPSAHISLF